MTIIGIFLLQTNVKANTLNFYEGEMIDGIYTRNEKNKSTFYQKARFFRRTSDNKAAYCIEPFTRFKDGSNYESSINPNNIDSQTWYNMSLMAFYGYEYPGHTDNKWYAITQLMIWQEADKNAEFYFTDTLNGNRINAYESEINEIRTLMENHKKTPSFSNTTIDLVEGEKLIVDQNNVLANYKEKDNKITITNNSLDISNLKAGSYDFNFIRSNQIENEPILFYYNNESQDLMTRGNINEQPLNLKVNIYKTELNVQKIDTDNQNSTSRGEGKLTEATFELFNYDKKKITEFKLDKNGKATLNNLKFGTYYIKEKEAGKGYLLNDNYYKIEISKDNPIYNITIENKVIEKEVFIHKEYGTEGNTTQESNITFEIYNQNGQIITTITTDEYGNAKVKLPYGTYTFKQKNSKEGYRYVDDFTVIIDESTKELAYNLYDYKIPVPNTRSNEPKSSTTITTLLLILISYFYVKKIYNI